MQIKPKLLKGAENTYPNEVYFKTADGQGVETKQVQQAIDFNIDDVIICKDDGFGGKEFQGQPINTFTPNITGAFTDITYADLVTKITNLELVKAGTYRITDYRTVHEMYDNSVIISGQTKTCAVEPLIVTAIDTNKLAPIAYSEQYPQDIIYYDVNNNQTVVPGCTHGYIYRRIDTLRNISLPFDWRNVTFRRWQISVTAEWDSITTYALSDIVLKPATNELYISMQNNNLNNALPTNAPFYNSLYWRRFEWDNGEYASWQTGTWKLCSGRSIPVQIDIPVSINYQDYNFLYDVDLSYHNNIVFSSRQYTGGDLISSYNTVIRYINSIGNLYFFGTLLSNNSIKNSMSYSYIYESLNNNSLYGIYGCHIYAAMSGNSFSSYFQYNILASSFLGNSGDTFGINNIAGSNFRYNALGYNFNYNTLQLSEVWEKNIFSQNFRHNNNSYGVVLANLDLSLATHIYNTYEKKIYKRPDGTNKLRYYDDTDTLQIVEVTA